MKPKKIEDQRTRNIGDGINKKKVDEMEKSKKKFDAEMSKKRQPAPKGRK